MSRSGGAQQLDSTVPKILPEISVFTTVFPCSPVEKNEMGEEMVKFLCHTQTQALQWERAIVISVTLMDIVFWVKILCETWDIAAPRKCY